MTEHLRLHSNKPSPFIVGVSRSGTTLLRLMLDAHPHLAIPPETHFIPNLIQVCSSSSDPLKDFLTALECSFSWPDHHIEISALRKNLSQESFTIAEGLRQFYATYAERFGKARWGDKTPTYLAQMTLIESALPESHFIHIIRDGRDVSLSIANLWFGPHPGRNSTEEVAEWWASRIRQGREEGSKVRNYFEVRYEDLVLNPEAVLRRLGHFIDLPWDESMLEYYRTASTRMAEIQAPNIGPDGKPTASASARKEIHRLTGEPPLASRSGRWKSEMSVEDQIRFLRIAGSLLEELGYQ